MTVSTLKHLNSLFIVLLVVFSLTPEVAEAKKPMPPFFKKMSKQHGVPVDVLYALAMTESNTRMRDGSYSPWPYTINIDFKGYRYQSYADLVRQSRSLLKQGRKSFDVGFFQVNWKWNGHRTKSIELLANPYENARVASEIMKEHYATYGNWVVAAGRYHNPANNRGLANVYSKNFARNLKKVRSEMIY
ncbi:transglycosylase SLT domain-containing protein [Vibrio rumoiensis]|uniref:Transglycosylase SLT domain-containing protein n=1 Tax=Vibrio rumoiensis TaxID=76258 RepID=A0ABW7J091_9VIBR